MRDTHPNCTQLYHLHRNLKRKLLNKLIYKYTRNLFEKKKMQKSLTMIDKKQEKLENSSIPISVSFKLIWYSMQ
jgi:hypothetical protein